MKLLIFDICHYLFNRVFIKQALYNFPSKLAIISSIIPYFYLCVGGGVQIVNDGRVRKQEDRRSCEDGAQGRVPKTIISHGIHIIHQLIAEFKISQNVM